MGLPGSGLSLGPGGDAPLDVHLSRAAPGALSVNDGSGRLELAGLHVHSTEGPPAPTDGVVLHSRSGSGRSDLFATSREGGSRILTSDGEALRVPMPCALGLHRSVGGDVVLRAGDAVWVPAPSLAEDCVLTHTWVEAVTGSGAASVTFAIVASGPDGLPGEVLGATGEGGADLAEAGVCGAELVQPVPIRAGRRWWVAVLAAGEGGLHVRLRGAGGLLAGTPLHLGTAPVRPTTREVDGSLRASGLSTIPASPAAGSGLQGGTAPVVHVSLEAPERARDPGPGAQPPGVAADGAPEVMG